MKYTTLLLILLAGSALASGKKVPPPFQNGDVDQNQAQDQAQTQDQTVNVNFGSDGQPLLQDADTTQLTTGDTTIDAGDTNFTSENTSSNVVLVPNNNTENCLRVFGIAFGKDGAAGSIGWPWRSKSCDYEQAADDAFAAGERDLGWFWKCQNKNLYRTFKLDGMSDDEAKLECHKKAVGMAGSVAVIDDLKDRLDAADNQIDLLRRHEKVCDESLERCKRALIGVGGK